MANRHAFSPDSAPPRMGISGSSALSNNVYIWGGVIFAIIILFVGGWVYFCYRRKLYTNFLRFCVKQKGKLNAEKMKLRQFRFEDLQKATRNFSEEFMVGSGAFGNVYVGTFGVEGILAIKKPNAESYTSTEEFRNEVRLLSKVKHRNLVQLVGFCEDSGPKTAKILVYEYVTNGSLLDYIIGRGGRSLSWRQRVNIAIGAAKGLAHLHEGVNPSIIHRDIKPSNILIGEGFEAKVSDFGLVRSGPVGDQSHVSSQVKGTPGYLDPAYCSSYHLTPFTDVYSFGVILLQLVAARPAIESTRNHANLHIIDWARPSIERDNIEEILDANLLVEGCNMEMMMKMAQLGLRCVMKEPKKRPTMTQVWQELEAELYITDDFLPKPPHRMDSKRHVGNSSRSIGHKNHPSITDQDYSRSINVSVDGIKLQRFRVDLDGFSFQSGSLRCLETSESIDDDFSIPR